VLEALRREKHAMEASVERVDVIRSGRAHGRFGPAPAALSITRSAAHTVADGARSVYAHKKHAIAASVRRVDRKNREVGARPQGQFS
jgi:hypothetical protein